MVVYASFKHCIHRNINVFAVGYKRKIFNSCLNSWFVLRNVVISRSGVVSSTVLTLMPKVLHYFLKVRNPCSGHWDRLLWSYDWTSLCLANCICCNWWLLLFAVWRNTVCFVRVHKKIVVNIRNRKTIAIKHMPICWWYIRIQNCWYFLHGHTIWNREHLTELTTNNVIASSLSN